MGGWALSCWVIISWKDQINFEEKSGDQKLICKDIRVCGELRDVPWGNQPRMIAFETTLACRSPLVAQFFFVSFFLVRKKPFTGVRTHVPTCQKVTRLLLSYRGDRPIYL